MQTLVLGPLSLSTHTVAVALALVAGLAALWLVARHQGLDAGFAIDAALGALLFAVIAARAEVVLANLEYFAERPELILSLSRGGLGHRSLVAVGVAGYLLGTSGDRGRWRHYAGALAPALALASAVLWAAAALTGQAAGAPVNSPVAMALPDAYGLVAPRLPLQLLMAATHLLLAAPAVAGLSRLPAGLSLPLWGAVSAAMAAVLANFRAEIVLLPGGLPRPLVADATVAFTWLLLAAALLLTQPRQETVACVAEPEPEPSPAATEAPEPESVGAASGVTTPGTPAL